MQKIGCKSERRKELLRSAMHRALFMTTDAVFVATAYLVACFVRFEGDIPASEATLMWRSLPLIVLTTILALEHFGLYRRIWRYAGFGDLVHLVNALTIGTLAGSVLIFLFGLRGHSRLVLLTFYPLTVVLVAGFRVGLRNLARLSVRTRARGVPSLVVGSGDTGEMVVREILKNPALPYNPVGIVSDTPGELGLLIHNVPVVGDIDDIPVLIADLGIKEVVVADPELSGAEFKRLAELCAPVGIPVRIFPSAGELLSGHVEVSRIRRIQIEDLLRRKPVPPDLKLMGKSLGGKRVLVTGAGGSIGSELCRQTCRAKPALLVMVDRVENSLYEIDTEIGERFPDVARSAQLVDIRWLARMEEVFDQFRPDVVFHAAAFKHVPLMEAHPREVVLNNIVGTTMLAQLALVRAVKDFVLISSDKAVNPVNVMGVSKRMTELYMQHLAHGPARGRTKFLAVRFGNVLGSAGSVIPRLKRQIEQGGPVTVTHPQMTRYFMTISEAVQLVIQAAAMAKGGEIFVLDMGEPVNVVDLAKDLITLSGLKPGGDIAITFTGLRPGEKLDEELWSESEDPQPTANHKITAIRAIAERNGSDLDRQIDELANLAEQGHVPEMIELLRMMVPEFSPQMVEATAGITGPVTHFRVLVADDESDMRHMISRALRRADLEVITAKDGVDALEKIRATPPHLVILDLMMPGLGGLEVFQQLKRDPATRHVPVMLMTAYPELGEETKRITFDADDFVSKPFRLPEFVTRVKGILHRRYRHYAKPSSVQVPAAGRARAAG
ncbi:MAG: polysaccharide biosynthesis protein [Candidatus Binatia bacterium]